MVIFKSKQKKFEGDLKIKFCGKRLFPTESVKYLGVKINTNLLAIKLNREMREYVSLKILRSIFFAIFDSYLSYCCFFWAQNRSTILVIHCDFTKKRQLELLIFNQRIPIPVPYSNKTSR